MSSPLAEPQRLGDPRLRLVRNSVAPPERQQFDIVKAIKVGLRGRLPVALSLGLFLGLFGVALVLLALTPQYQSQGMLKLAARDPSLLNNNTDDTRLRLYDSFTLAETSFITTRPVLERAFLKASTSGARGLPADVPSLEEMLDVSGAKGIITVNARDRDPRVAAIIVNAVLDGYNEVHVEQGGERFEFRERELAARAGDLTTKLGMLDRNILKVGGQYDETTLTKAHNDKLRMIDRLAGRIANLEARLAGGKDTAANNGLSDALTSDDVLANLNTERSRKLADVATLSVRYSEKSKRLIAARLALAAVEQAILDRRGGLSSAGVPSDGEEAEAKTPAQIKALLSRLNDSLKQAQREAEDLNNRAIQMNQLAGEREQTRTLLDETNRALDQARLDSRNMQMSPAEIIKRGEVSVEPFRDKRGEASVLAMLGGFGLSFALFIGLAVLHPRVRFADDLKTFAKAVTYAGFINPDDCASVHMVRNYLQLALGKGGEGEALLRPGEPAPHALRKRVQQAMSDEGGRSIAVVALHKGAAAWSVAEKLARSFGDVGARTLAMDADLSTPRLTGAFKLQDRPGLRNFLSADGSVESVPCLVREGRVDILSTGVGPASDASLSLGDVRRLVAASTLSHDFALLDCGEVENRLAAGLFAAEADLVLGVVKEGACEVEIRAALTRLTAITQRPVHTIILADPRADADREWVKDVPPALRRLALGVIKRVKRKFAHA